MLDFDCIDDWAQQLSIALEDHLHDGIASTLVGAAPEFIEDARDLLFELTDKDAIIDAMLAWIRSTQVVGYHGTRLTDAEVESIRDLGLLPLSARARRDRLSRALSAHPRWDEVADGLDAAIQAHGPGASAGQRENQVHPHSWIAARSSGSPSRLSRARKKPFIAVHPLFSRDNVTT